MRRLCDGLLPGIWAYRRLRMLEKAASLDIPVYVALAPFMPFHDYDVLERVVAAVAPLKPKQVFCEVLNPKGDNISMMQEALLLRVPSTRRTDPLHHGVLGRVYIEGSGARPKADQAVHSLAR